MRVLLQDGHTGLYRGPNGTWVSNAADAVEFRDIEAAGESAFACDRDEVNVVLRYEEPQCELALNPIYCIRQVPGARAIRAH